MLRINVSLKIVLSCSLIITLITRIFDKFVFGLNMSLEMSVLRCLEIAVITGILLTFMLRLDMSSKIPLDDSLIITFIAEIFDFFGHHR